MTVTMEPLTSCIHDALMLSHHSLFHHYPILLWERQTGQCLLTLRGERPYERMNISSVTGITEAQRASLKALGAIE